MTATFEIIMVTLVDDETNEVIAEGGPELLDLDERGD